MERRPSLKTTPSLVITKAKSEQQHRMDVLETRKKSARNWFESLAARIIAAFEALEDDSTPRFIPARPAALSAPPGRAATDEGGGVMGMMRGRLFEKVGVHVSTVHGAFSPDFAKQVKGAAEDPRFWASGISLIAHMRNPHIPAVHMNTRMIVTTQSWFGGGADLNPTLDAARAPRSSRCAWISMPG